MFCVVLLVLKVHSNSGTNRHGNLVSQATPFAELAYETNEDPSLDSKLSARILSRSSVGSVE